MSRLLRDIVSGGDRHSPEPPETPRGTAAGSTPGFDVSETETGINMTAEGALPASREGMDVGCSFLHMSAQSPPDSRPISPASLDRSGQKTSAENPDSSLGAHEKKTRSKTFRKRRGIHPRLVLQNSGSVARDHLASERTFLAYVRTSLAIASAGVALVQLFTIADITARSRDILLSNANKRVQRFARPLGITMVLFALITLVIGIYRYFLVQFALPDQKFPTARISVAFISFVLGSVTIVIFGALLSGRVES